MKNSKSTSNFTTSDSLNVSLNPIQRPSKEAPFTSFKQKKSDHGVLASAEDAFSNYNDDRNKWIGRVFPLQRGTVMFTSFMFLRVLFFTMISVLLLLLQYYNYEFGGLVFRPIGHTLLGTALGLLLVYRTNASYDRFWEGRKLIATISAACLGLNRCIKVWEPQENLQEMTNLLLCFHIALKNRLRREPERTEEYSKYLSPEQIEFLRVSNDDPYFLVTLMQRWVFSNCKAINTHPGRTTVINNFLNDLVTSETSCDRLIDTPIPISYVAHASHLVFIFLITLPFCIIDELGWFSIPMMMMVSFGLIGIDEAGAEIEQPFGTDANDLKIEVFFDRTMSILSNLSDIELPDVTSKNKKPVETFKVV